MRKLKLLIADDEEASREGLARCVDWEKLGVTLVGSAKNGREALDLAWALAPNIVLTDIRMPFMDGVELARELRARSFGAEIIFITGYEDVSYLHQAIENDVCAYILKPVDVSELSRAIEKAVRALEAGRLEFYADSDTAAPGRRRLISERVREFVLANISGEITAQDVADAIGYSPTRAAQLVRAETGVTLNEFVTGIRMRRAMELMNETDTRIYEIATSVGYRDTKYFSRLFKRYWGSYPSENRR